MWMLLYVNTRMSHDLAGLEKWFQRWRGLGLGGSRGKGSLRVWKGPKPPIQLLQLLKNSPRKVKRAHFRYILGPPWSHPGDGIAGARRGRSPPSTPVSPAMRSRILSESKVVSCSPVKSTLHRHDIIRARFLTSARHVKMVKNCFLEGAFKKMHVNFSSSIQGDFFTGQKVNSYYYTIKHVYYIKIYILIITTLGHLVCTWELTTWPIYMPIGHVQSAIFTYARLGSSNAAVLLEWHCPHEVER